MGRRYTRLIEESCSYCSRTRSSKLLKDGRRSDSGLAGTIEGSLRFTTVRPDYSYFTKEYNIVYDETDRYVLLYDDLKTTGWIF